MELDRDALPPRRWLVRGALAVFVCVLLAPGVYAAFNPQSVELAPGTVERTADNETYVSIQGFHFDGTGDPKKPARLVAADENAELLWNFDGEEVGARWFYDVDPMANGNLFVTSTNPGGTVVFEFDPETNDPVWTEQYDLEDTHNVDYISDDRLLVANMREYENGVSNDRLFIADNATGETEWEWQFRDHYSEDTDGGFGEDWTHVNDAEVIGDGDRYVLASPRNFDQSIVIDRETDEIVMRLGEDDNHDILFEQHNPDYFERADGTPVMVVADSENDRVVEYERNCGDADPRLGAGTPPDECSWERTWSVDGFNWPRDADRLENGNTLVTDTLNHRVVEVSPQGEVVWEFHAGWAPYDAERGEKGSNGPAISEQGASGSYTVHGGDDEGPAGRYTVADAIIDVGSGTVIEDGTNELATRWAHIEPWVRPVWMDSWTALSVALGGVLTVFWGLSEVVLNRRRLFAAVRNRFDRFSSQVRD
ncbi:aryl-sulfate sulfotransferase [Halostella pelagica]|uniref:aryl-sulfate sulfotransferase n=1 Tax=Halostella pelagica TaxID=2583824 RepID=UPI0010817E36|nr:aryl-sulfate sulfotransferase [Halostella pelagica]